MTLRLGFCGVGRWAQKLATAFRACGAEIVAYDRRREDLQSPGILERAGLIDVTPESSGYGIFGKRTPWREQLADPSIDAIVAVATPEVTTEVALACAAAGKAVMATKPLFDHPETIRAPFYVDFWRLWAGAQREWKSNQFWFTGSGPFRGFPGSFDYGPHVIAACIDAGFPMLDECRAMPSANGGELFHAVFSGGGDNYVTACFGNGSDGGTRSVWGHEETSLAIGGEPKDQILQRFCQSFLNDISEGFVDTRLLNLSRDGMRELRRIREMAK